MFVDLEEIKILKELLDINAISLDEYIWKKRQLLGMEDVSCSEIASTNL